MFPIDLLPDSHRDFDESFDWYGSKSPEVAVRFTNAINEALAEVGREPERFARIDERHRERLVKKFPFRIFYRITNNRVVVVAIAHAKRNPSYWHSR